MALLSNPTIHSLVTTRLTLLGIKPLSKAQSEAVAIVNAIKLGITLDMIRQDLDVTIANNLQAVDYTPDRARTVMVDEFLKALRA